MKRGMLCIILCFVVFMSGCTSLSSDSVQKIASPENNRIPITGKWEVTKFLAGTKSQLGKANDVDWIGKKLQFSKDEVSFDEYVWNNPEYKTKKVNAQEYFLYNRDFPLYKLNIKNNELLVITVTSEDNFLGDFIEINDKEMVAVIQNNYYYMNKISDSVDKNLAVNVSSNGSDYNLLDSYWKGPYSKSGLLLGLKSPVGKNGEYNYRTLWIDYDKKTLQPILETKDIFFPRKSGFWKLNVSRVQENNITEDVIYASDASDSSYGAKAQTPDGNLWINREGHIYRSIDFVCNDYISLETLGAGVDIENGEDWNINSLQVEPVDSLPQIKGVTISDLAGDDGLTVMDNAREELLKSLNLQSNIIVNNANNEDNFGVIRKSGHWLLEGRISLLGDINMPYLDYNINVIPPQKLVTYDTLCIPWTDIKDKVPETVDAYTSPNKDIAIIVTKDRVEIYAINNGKLSGSPLEKIELNSGESVIMAEWAMGNYVDNWEKSFLKNDTSQVKAIK